MKPLNMRAGLWCMLFLLPAVAAGKDSAASKSGKATTARSARQDALRAIPQKRLTAQARQKVAAVLDDVSIYRRLPAQSIQCDPSFYRFLVEHPELVVNIWEVMGVSEIAISRQNDGKFQANDGAGTLASVEYLYRSAGLHLIYAEGSYQGSVFAEPIRGKCLLLLRTSQLRDKGGKKSLDCRLDAFMQLEQFGVEVLAKTLQPVVGKVADHNFREITAFIAQLQRTAADSPGSLERMAVRLSRVAPADRRTFAELSLRLGVEASVSAAPRKQLSADKAAAAQIPLHTRAQSKKR